MRCGCEACEGVRYVKCEGVGVEGVRMGCMRV